MDSLLRHKLRWRSYRLVFRHPVIELVTYAPVLDIAPAMCYTPQTYPEPLDNDFQCYWIITPLLVNFAELNRKRLKVERRFLSKGEVTTVRLRWQVCSSALLGQQRFHIVRLSNATRSAKYSMRGPV